MTTKFSRSFSLPGYLEEALAPFSWSGILSDKFRTDIVLCLMASEREVVTADFVTSLRLLKFLDSEWVESLSSALTRFAGEGFRKGDR